MNSRYFSLTILQACIGFFTVFSVSAHSEVTSNSLNLAPTKTWGVEITEVATGGVKDLATTGGYQNSANLGLTYKWGGKKFSLQSGFDYNPTSWSDRKSEFIERDLSLGVSWSLGQPFGAERAYSSFRLSAPTSRASIKSTQLLATRWDNFLLIPISNSKWSFDPWVVLKTYSYQTGHADLGEVIAYGIFSYEYSPSLSPFISLDHDLMFKVSDRYKKSYETFGPEVGVTLRFIENTKLSLSVSQNRNILNPATDTVSDHSLFAANESYYNLYFKGNF